MAVSVKHLSVYDELIELIANKSISSQILNFKPSPKIQKRINNLLEKNRSGNLSSEEKSELDEFEHLEHIFRLAKSRLRQKLNL